MRRIGLLQRRFDSSVEFLGYIGARASAALAGGALTALGGGIAVALVHRATAEVWFAGLAVAGAILAAAGAHALRYTARARATLGAGPRHMRLTTTPRSGPGPLRTLRATVLPDEHGSRAEFEVAWGSFGTTALDAVPANVYGPLRPGSVALAVCGEGFVIGTVGRTSRPLRGTDGVREARV